MKRKKNIFTSVSGDCHFLGICGEHIGITPTHGVYKSFHKNGKLKEVYNTIFGRIIGMYLKFYDNGNLNTVGYYKGFDCFNEYMLKRDSTRYFDSLTYEIIVELTIETKSIKTGEWLFYDRNGNLVKRAQYDKTGRLIKEEEW